MTVSCDDFQALGAELALGILDLRQGAEVLAHVASCPACHRELLGLRAVANRIVCLSPRAEPPIGFEIRVLSSLAVLSSLVLACACDEGDALSWRARPD